MRIFQSTLVRFFTPLFIIVLIGIALSTFATSYRAKEILYKLKEQESLAVLKNVAEVVAEYRRSIEDYRKSAIEARKRELAHIVQNAMSVVKENYQEALSGKMSEKEARKRTMKILSHMRYGHNDYIFGITEDYRLVIHPDPKMKHKNLYNLRDPNGVYVIRDLVKVAKDSPDGSCGYVFYHWPRYIGGKPSEPEPKLSAAAYFKPWGWVIGTGVYISDIKKEIARKKEQALSRLRSKLGEMHLGKYGYAVIFDQDGNLIYHPYLMGSQSSGNSYTSQKIKEVFARLKEVAKKPWGENVLEYYWNHPGDKKHFIYRKIAWCTREPLTGWYVVVSAYKDEIEAPVRTLLSSIILPPIIMVIPLFFILLLLLKKLLSPVDSMVSACKKIEKEGDFSVRVPENIPGEMGILARQLNHMINSVRNFNKELERKIKERTRELVEKTRELEKANERLKELDQTKSAFLSSVSHELRTPLTSVLGFAKLIHKDFVKSFLPLAKGNKKLERKGERVKENLEIIIHEGERLTRLINDVLDLAKIESGRVEWRDSLFPLKEVLESSIRSVEGQFAEKPNVELRLELPENLPEIHADKDKLQQVFINLLNNAAKFTEKGYVRLSAEVVDSKVRIMVEDTGCGIPEDERDKIFDKFHQVVQEDTLKDKPKGTGLGLAICKQIIEHYKGRIWVESEVGKGSTFFVELPLQEKAEEASKESEAHTATTEEAPETKEVSPLILVVDDDESIRNLLTQLFTDAGYRVTTAENGLEALKKAREEHPDLITMDIMMPVMDGKTAIDHLRGDPELSKIPIVIISVLSPFDEAKGDVFIEKPIDEEQLLRTVDSFLKSKEDTAQRPCLVVEKGEFLHRQKMVLLCSEKIQYCSKDELTKRLSEGFKGTVIIPYEIHNEINLSDLNKLKDIQIVIL